MHTLPVSTSSSLCYSLSTLVCMAVLASHCTLSYFECTESGRLQRQGSIIYRDGRILFFLKMPNLPGFHLPLVFFPFWDFITLSLVLSFKRLWLQMWSYLFIV